MFPIESLSRLCHENRRCFYKPSFVTGDHSNWTYFIAQHTFCEAVTFSMRTLFRALMILSARYYRFTNIFEPIPKSCILAVRTVIILVWVGLIFFFLFLSKQLSKTRIQDDIDEKILGEIPDEFLGECDMSWLTSEVHRCLLLHVISRVDPAYHEFHSWLNVQIQFYSRWCEIRSFSLRVAKQSIAPWSCLIFLMIQTIHSIEPP